MNILLAFVIGSCLGSFFNVLIDRLSTNRPIAKGRSYCESCKKTLSPLDLIPVFSFIFLLGKCRYCRKSIPFRIFLVELLSGLTFTLIGYQILNLVVDPVAGILLAVLILCFIGIFFADLEYGIIPDKLVLAGLIVTILYLQSTGQLGVANIFAGIATFIFFLALYIGTKGRGMGFGDVKFSLILGLFLGYPNVIVALYLAFLTGAIISIILVVWRKIRFFGGTIPFGPFLVASTLAAHFFGNQILQMFISRFF